MSADGALIRKLIAEIEAMPEWRVRRASGNHTTIFPPDKGKIISVSSTPSEYRWRRNLRAQLRQAGWTGTLLD
jgi:hypothetical protein